MAREIELQASLQHPSIVQIYAAFEDKEGIYVVQEFALGGDLYAQLAQAGGYLAEDQVAGEVMVPVLDALGYMHDKVIVHLSPGHNVWLAVLRGLHENVLLCKPGSVLLSERLRLHEHVNVHCLFCKHWIIHQRWIIHDSCMTRQVICLWLAGLKPLDAYATWRMIRRHARVTDGIM